MSNKRQAQVFTQPQKGGNMRQTSEQPITYIFEGFCCYTDLLKVWTIVGSIRPQGRGQAEAEDRFNGRSDRGYTLSILLH